MPDYSLKKGTTDFKIPIAVDLRKLFIRGVRVFFSVSVHFGLKLRKIEWISYQTSPRRWGRFLKHARVFTLRVNFQLFGTGFSVSLLPLQLQIYVQLTGLYWRSCCTLTSTPDNHLWRAVVAKRNIELWINIFLLQCIILWYRCWSDGISYEAYDCGVFFVLWMNFLHALSWGSADVNLCIILVWWRPAILYGGCAVCYEFLWRWKFFCSMLI